MDKAQDGAAEEAVFFTEVAPDDAVIDSGATLSVVGEITWQMWLDKLAKHGKTAVAKKVVHDFRFGDGATLRSEKESTASLVPGSTPMLLA